MVRELRHRYRNAQKGLIRALAKSAVCLVNLSANGAKVAGKVPAKDFRSKKSKKTFT